MTFAVIELGSGSEKIVGTIWADAESQAQSVASDLLNLHENDKVVIRRSEEREIPLKPFE